jgi:hypothetical protein
MRINILIIAFILTSCISPQVKEKLNVKYSGPDEFSIISHEPLVIPHDFNQPLPTPGLASKSDRSQNFIELNSTEQALLKKAKTNKQNLDNVIIKKSSNNWFDHLLNHNKEREYKVELPKNSLDIIRNKPDYIANTPSRRVCDITGGNIKYCNEHKLMKSFEVPVK